MRILGAVHRGSALTETLILFLVLVPMWLIIPLFGNLNDLKQTTLQASRYSAWEHTVSNSGQSPSDIRARFYQNPEVLLSTGQVEQSGVLSENPLWGNSDAMDRAHDDTLANSLRISFAEGGGHSLSQNIGDSGIARSMGKGIEETGKILDFMSSVKWDIEGDGMLEAGVQVNVRKNRLFPTQGSSCANSVSQEMFSCVRGSNVILIDGWDSGTNVQAEDRSRAFVPGVVLEDIGKGLSYLGEIPTFKELKGLENAFGYVDSTQLPLDRYIGPYERAH